MGLTSVKSELVVCFTREGDSIPEEEEDSEEAVQRFFDSEVSLELLT